MKLRLIRLGLALAGNAIGLILASVLLSDMSINGLGFVVALLVFSAVTALAEPLVTKMADRYIDALSGASTLIATAVSLGITAAISDGLSISGVSTWVLATVIVWLSAVILGVVLTKLVIKEAVT